MNLLHLSFKNATIKWWRSLTLGLFIFTISFVMILANSFLTAVKDKVDTVIANGITGHVQIRSDRSFEGDMVSQYNTGWDALKPLHPATLQTVQSILKESFPAFQQHLLIRQSAYLMNSEKREETLLIGIGPDFTHYREAFQLTEGRFLDPTGDHEILLTEEQARAFRVQTGEMITVMTKNRYGLNSRMECKVVGIGNFIMLSLFSYKACYVHDTSVREITHLNTDEVTDLILFLPDRSQAADVLPAMAKVLQGGSLETVMTKNDKLASDDLYITSLDFTEDLTDQKLKLSSYKEMGLSFKSAGDIIFITLNIVILLLMIVVSILIMNLVYMMGIERYREIGTLRAIGFTRSQVVRIFVGEILLISILFGLTGLLVGTGLILIFGHSGIASPIPAMDFIMGKTLFLQVRLSHIFSTILVFTGFSLAASFYPAYQACSVRPAEIMRSV